MKKPPIKAILYSIFLIIAFLLLVWLMMWLVGCQSAQRPEIVPKTLGEQNLVNVVKQLGIFTWLAIGSIAIGAAALANGSKSAITWIVGGVVALGLSLAVIAYAKWIALGTLIGAVVWFVYSLFIGDKGFLVLRNLRR